MRCMFRQAKINYMRVKIEHLQTFLLIRLRRLSLKMPNLARTTTKHWQMANGTILCRKHALVTQLGAIRPLIKCLRLLISRYLLEPDWAILPNMVWAEVVLTVLAYLPRAFLNSIP